MKLWDVINALLFFIPIGIYYDATKHGIGRVGKRKLFNLSAGGWAVAAIFLWFIAIPAYLLKHKKLIEIAKTDPVFLSLSHRIVIGLIIVIFSGCLTYFLIFNAVGQEQP